MNMIASNPPTNTQGTRRYDHRDFLASGRDLAVEHRPSLYQPNTSFGKTVEIQQPNSSSFRKQSSLSSVEFIKLMNEVDGNQDGVLERSEFSAFLSKFALRAGIELKELTQGLLVECQKECVLLQNDQRGSDSFWDSRGSGSFWDSFTLSLAEEAVETVSRVESTSTMGS